MNKTKQQTLNIPVSIDNEAQVPQYNSSEASGADVRAYLQEEKTILPGTSALIPTGIKMEIPHGYEVQVRPRSGLAFKHQVTVLNTPGTIDSDYRGELRVILINHGKEPFVITPNMRIAQLVLAPVVQANWVVAEHLNDTERGDGGFGHTGTH